MDLLINTATGSSDAYIQDLRNSFGEHIPLYGAVATCEYEEGVELSVGKDATRDYSYLLSMRVNSVIEQQNAIRSNAVGTGDARFHQRREFIQTMYEPAWQRTRAIWHTGAVAGAGPYAEQRDEIIKTLRDYAKKFNNPTDAKTAQSVSTFMLWYLLTGDKLKDNEVQAVASAGVTPFVGNWQHYLLGGYFLLYRGADAVVLLNNALMRSPDYYEAMVKAGRAAGFDAVDVMRALVGYVFTGGGPGMALALRGTLSLIESDPKRFLPLYEQNPYKFIEEYLRVKAPVAETSFLSLIERKYTSGGREVTVHPGDKVCASFIATNTNADLYGTTDVTFQDSHVTDPDFSNGEFLGFMGKWGLFDLENPIAEPVRGCPGMHMTTQCMILYIEAFKHLYK